MIAFPGRGLLLDIEGTTSPVQFVFEVMFPYVREHLGEFLRARWDEPELAEACRLIAAESASPSLEALLGEGPVEEQRRRLEAEVLRQMDADLKATGLKALQGMIWHDGFVGGALRAEVYEDVLPALQRWTQAGRDVRIYSSGSVAAQKLFFGHTVVGNLLPYFKGHYDTTIGSKREAESYRNIAASFGLPPAEILFVSDLLDELQAAREAGLATALCVRPGNQTVAGEHGFEEIYSFEKLEPV